MRTESLLKYTKEHVWVRVDGNKAYIGVAEQISHRLGKIIFVELPVIDDEYQRGDVVSVLESVKDAFDVHSPVSGKVTAVNEDLGDIPGLIDENPYEAWILALEMDNPAELDFLLDEGNYEPFSSK